MYKNQLEKAGSVLRLKKVQDSKERKCFCVYTEEETEEDGESTWSQRTMRRVSPGQQAEKGFVDKEAGV